MFETQIDNGIRFLDEHKGLGWENDVNIETLDLNMWDMCVLGQLYGDEEGFGFDAACRNFGWVRTNGIIKNWNFPAEYGFATKKGQDYSELTAAWKGAILKLRESDRLAFVDECNQAIAVG